MSGAKRKGAAINSRPAPARDGIRDTLLKNPRDRSEPLPATELGRPIPAPRGRLMFA